MNILIVGIGALGGLIAARLTAAGASVSLATRDAESAARLKASGLRVIGVGGAFAVEAMRVAPLDAYDGSDRFDLIVLATKAHDAIEVAPRLSRLLKPGATLLPIQNGGVPQMLADRVGDCVLGGLSNLGATMETSGVYEQRNDGHLLIGELAAGESERTEQVQRCLGRAVQVCTTNNFRGAVWSKLLVNCSVTTIGAITGCTMREFINAANGKEIFNRTYDEALSIALACGARPERMFVDPIPPGWCGRSVASEAHDAWIGQLLKGYGDVKPSMLQDIQRGRPTEIDFINGYVVSVARRLGVPAPLNAMIVETVHSITAGKIVPNPALLGPAYAMLSRKRSNVPLYVRIAEAFTRQVATGVLRPGDRVPSLRRLSREQGVSLSTALQAYVWLENRGYLEARPQSGFYIRTPFAKLIPEPQAESLQSQPAAMGTNAVLEEIIRSANDPAFVPFGAGCASAELFPNRRLNLIARGILRKLPLHSGSYDFPPGVEAFRRQIARRSLAIRCEVAPRDVIVTAGALEAIHLSLRAVAKPGDVIAVESPLNFLILGCVASLNMKTIEIPTHPQEGMDLEQLERAIRKHKIKACITITNCHNPLGFVLSDKFKRDLVDLTGRLNVAVIEDDLCGDLAFDGPRPLTAKSFDRKGLVLLCSSFSKILSHGFRVGWVLAGRFRADVERLKLLTNVAAPSLPQLVLAEFLESGSYDRHVRRLRATLACQLESVRQAIARYFPAGTRISRPAGGYMLWIELPQKVDALKLHRASAAERISILPGVLFSATGQYKNYIRINCAHVWTKTHDQALLILGRLCERQL